MNHSLKPLSDFFSCNICANKCIDVYFMSKLFAHLRSYGRGTVSKHMSNLDEMKKAKIQPLLRRQVL